MLLSLTFGFAVASNLKSLAMPIIVRSLPTGSSLVTYEPTGDGSTERVIGLSCTNLGPVRVSPNGKQVAFIHNRKLYVTSLVRREIEGTPVPRLECRASYSGRVWSGVTEVADSVTSSMGWSPDSRKLAYVRATFSGPTPNNEAIWVAQFDRGTTTHSQLTTARTVDERATAPAISPSGSRISYWGPSYAGVVWSIRSDGTDRQAENPGGSTLDSGGWNQATWVNDTTLVAPLFSSAVRPTGVYTFGRGGARPTQIIGLSNLTIGPLVRDGAVYYTRPTRIGTTTVSRAYRMVLGGAERMYGPASSSANEVLHDVVMVAL